MTVRKKFHIIILSWFVLGSAILLVTKYIDEKFIILLFALAIFLGIYSLSLKCPNCNKRVLHNTINISGIKMDIWTVWIPKTCQRCGNRIH